LSETGREEARALRQSPWILSDGRRWRTYSSDLQRAHDTARLALMQGDIANETESISTVTTTIPITDVLDDDRTLDNIERTTTPADGILLDQRLRERAYGAREGLPRSMSMDEAVAHRRREDNGGATDESSSWGLYETEEDVTRRCETWFHQVIAEAREEVLLRRDTSSLVLPLHVFAFSHAGWIRALLLRYVETSVLQQHPRADYTDHGSTLNKLLIVNAGVTVLDVFYDVSATAANDEDHSNGDGAILEKGTLPSLEVELVELNCQQHLSSVERKSAHSG
jgi:broad specificity phosphatase PhoE